MIPLWLEWFAGTTTEAGFREYGINCQHDDVDQFVGVLVGVGTRLGDRREVLEKVFGLHAVLRIQRSREMFTHQSVQSRYASIATHAHRSPTGCQRRVCKSAAQSHMIGPSFFLVQSV